MAEQTIFIEWKSTNPSGSIQVLNGQLNRCRIAGGDGSSEGDRFRFTGGPARLEVTVSEAQLDFGAYSTLVSVRAEVCPFSFFLRDVRVEQPLYIPDCEAVVTAAQDNRSYAEVEAEVHRRAQLTSLQRIELEAEESFESAARHTRHQPNCPTWLGISRDMRIFSLNLRQGGDPWDWIQPQLHSHPVTLPENDNNPVRYNFTIGRGISCAQELRRRLMDGNLPILQAELRDGGIAYHLTAFASLEYRELSRANLRGTHFLVADSFGYGNMQTAEQAKLKDSLLSQELERDEETVLYCRVEAVNISPAPRYAWMKAPSPNAFQVSTTVLLKSAYDGAAGIGCYPSGGSQPGRVYLVARLNGKPLPQEETALLLQPGECAVYDFYLPHRPISTERARSLSQQDFAARLAECRSFWREKLNSAAQFHLPEPRIDEMLRAGLLHLDLITYGLEPDGSTTPCIGVYCPIGSESSPIMQFFDAMGWHDLAQRSLSYFLDKQHDDGFIQNFGGYMLETGAALWSMGEHYRCTGDDAWVRRIQSKLIKACDYLLRWSDRNKREELRGRGYGLLEGKTADPEDLYHSFMLNGYAYLGMSRVAEMLHGVDPEQAGRIRAKAEELKGYIRSALAETLARSPVVPLGDGSWCPSAPPWVEARGPVSLFAEGGNWLTHGAFNARDSLLGPLYLVLQEVVAPDEPFARWMLSSHAELMTERNVAFTQPYYSPHPWVHLKRGEVKPFLKAYYNTVSALADRETYSFWEHLFQVSPNKTHEEGWFLMQTRWMLYLEDGAALQLLPGIPRQWLEDGKSIVIDGAACYFGKISLHVKSDLSRQRIEARVGCSGNSTAGRTMRQLERILLRLPHPEGRRAVRVSGGVYDADNETVIIEPVTGSIEVVVEY